MMRSVDPGSGSSIVMNAFDFKRMLRIRWPAFPMIAPANCKNKINRQRLGRAVGEGNAHIFGNRHLGGLLWFVVGAAVVSNAAAAAAAAHVIRAEHGHVRTVGGAHVAAAAAAAAVAAAAAAKVAVSVVVGEVVRDVAVHVVDREAAHVVVAATVAAERHAVPERAAAAELAWVRRVRRVEVAEVVDAVSSHVGSSKVAGVSAPAHWGRNRRPRVDEVALPAVEPRLVVPIIVSAREIAAPIVWPVEALPELVLASAAAVLAVI